MDILAALTGILVLAGLSEALVEYLISPIVKAREEDKEPIPPGSAGLNWRDLVLRYTAAGVGVTLCVVYRADILVFFDLVSPWPWIGYVVTGILIGRGSNFVHDFASRWLTKPPYE